jgi:TonB family protein
MLATVIFHVLIISLWFTEWPLERQSVPVSAVSKYVPARLVSADDLQKKPIKKKKTAVKKKNIYKNSVSTQPKTKLVKKAEPKSVVILKVEEDKAAEQNLTQNWKLAELELSQAMEKEERLLEAIDDLGEAQSYVAIIAQAVQNSWSRPPSARNNMEAELIIQLIPTGEVVSVNIVKSSGQLAFDRSAINAVKKAERFPELQELPSRVFEKHFRRLRLKFRPEDLRL